jgi:hypothetical protein
MSGCSLGRTEGLFWIEPIPVDSISYKPRKSWVAEPARHGIDFRFVTAEGITPKIVKSLEEGAPYTRTGTKVQREYQDHFSVSRTEQIVDHSATPHYLQLADLELPVDPFVEDHAIPLSQRATQENQRLDADSEVID